MNTGRAHALPVGRAARLLVGMLLLVEGGRHVVGATSSLVLATAAVIAGELLIYVALQMLIERVMPTINRWLGAVIAVAPVVLIFATSAAPGRLGTLLFVGLSLIATAVRNDAGCEVMTLPGMLFGRRTHLVCLAFSPLDWIEARLSRPGRGSR